MADIHKTSEHKGDKGKMLDQWEEFTAGPVRTNAAKIYVTINCRAQIFLNKRAYATLGSPEGVRLFYNKVRRRIGLRAAEVRSESVFPVRATRGTGSGRQVSILSFCRHHRIKVEGTIAFSNAKLTPDGMLVLDLNETRTITRAKGG